MKSKKRTKAKRLSSPATMQTAKIPPTSTSDAGMPSMFNNAQNKNITGGSFSITTNINTGNTLSLDVLYRRVAPNAILNAGGRADEVRCHPGTREEVIGRIEKWGETQDGLTAPIFWLSGPAGWPSDTDVNFIVKKSSGQFIYAATVMRFILDSSASPMVSLERVQGAVQLATKLPFPHLDAIYSYVLSQVDDQDALKDILHAQILIQKCRAALPQLQLPTSATLPSLIELLELYNRKYSKAMVLSCLADLTPISQYKSNVDELLFHHASFPDYLLDKSRSMNYFVDITAFSFKIQPIVWELIATELPHESWVSFGLGGLIQLQNLPPGLIETLISSKNAWSNDGQREISAFASTHNLCISDDDFVNFRRLICR
ncbi:hypothetical protein D9619_011198 [Psilocybe cf. subviscida]|uniref:Uncharacterized protein n=1 Tax=Psilocybe cf. subviscida TaxID=2480587 RepID=A0A8H5BJE4_9AGAR|nr:hypothetical protein D9619_011198 [Psilocybe cf. subviscida]